ncbi:MAG: hypothetical protein IH621_01325 [Krumholzibacteria bacterium]|nr:hypothetical protein [Candidatus Krumholzibacteria bacterium]
MQLQDLKRTWRAAGPGGVLLDLSCRVGYKLTRLLVMNALVLEPGKLNRDFLEFPTGYRHGFLDPADVLRHAGGEGLDLPATFVEVALAKGDLCFGILVGDRLVSYVWYAATATLVTDELVLRFAPDYHYRYKGYTLAEYRGQRLYSYGCAHALAELTARGSRGSIGLVDVNNFASMRTATRTGCVPAGRFFAWNVGGGWSIRSSGDYARYGMSMDAGPLGDASSRA